MIRDNGGSSVVHNIECCGFAGLYVYIRSDIDLTSLSILRFVLCLPQRSHDINSVLLTGELLHSWILEMSQLDTSYGQRGVLIYI